MVHGPGIDLCILEQYNKQVNGFEMALVNFFCNTATTGHAKELISKLILSAMEAPIIPIREGICLPKISVPTFDGYVCTCTSYNGNRFVNNSSCMYTKVPKIVSCDKASTSEGCIEGQTNTYTCICRIIERLAQMVHNYSEAISCLRQHYLVVDRWQWQGTSTVSLHTVPIRCKV